MNYFLDNRTVLIVDDDRGCLGYAAACLQDKSFMIVKAEDGVEGLKKFNEFHPDLILTDIQMPIVNGLELIAAVRKRDAAVKIIAVSSEKYFLENALECGANDALVKPFMKQDLCDLIDDLLQG